MLVKGLKMRWWLELGMGIGLYLTALFVNHIGRLNVMPNCFYGPGGGGGGSFWGRTLSPDEPDRATQHWQPD